MRERLPNPHVELGPRSLGGSSDHSDLDEQAGNEVRAHRRPYRLHSPELLLVDGVERGEVSQVNEVNKARNDVVERRSGSLEHGLDVVEGLLGLLDEIVAYHVPRVRIEAALAGHEAELVERHVTAEQMRRRDFRDYRGEHDELAALSDRDHDRDAGQNGGSGERRVRERCEQDREQADCEYGAGGAQRVSAAHPRYHSCRRYLRYDDEEGVDEDDDTDLTGPDRCMSHRKRREDVGEEGAADQHEREVARDQGEQEPIPSDSSETLCALARRRSFREARIRDPDEHNQHEDDERDCVEEVEPLEGVQVMVGGCDDEARDRRAEAETEVA